MRKLTRLLPALCALSLLPLHAHAATNIAEVDIEPSFAGGNGPTSVHDTEAGPASASSFSTGGGSPAGNSAGSGTSAVNYGVIKLSGDFSGSGTSLTRGTYNDSFTISSPTIAKNTPGTFTFAVSLNGTLTALVGGASAAYHLQVTLNGGPSQLSISGAQNNDENTGQSYTGSPLGTFTGTAGFLWGQPNTLQVFLQATAGAGYSNFDLSHNVIPEALFDLAHSSYWQGISNLTANGSAVTSGFTLTSDSGTNYLNSLAPTPEPTTLALLSTAALPLLLRTRRRLTTH